MADRLAARGTAPEARAGEPLPRPRILILQEPFAASGVAAALEEQGYQVIAPARAADAWMTVRDVDEAPSLLVLPVSDGELEAVRRLRRLRALGRVPILGVTHGGGRPAALEPLRSLGVVGLVDAGAPLDNLLFRIEQIVRPRRSGRRYERSSVFFPVEVGAGEGPFRVHYAITLAVGGMGLLAHVPIEPNTDVRLRFALAPELGSVDLSGRVVYCQEDPGAPGTYRLGLFFYPMAQELERALVAEVDRRLRA